MSLSLTRHELSRLEAHLNWLVLDYEWSANFRGNTRKRRDEARANADFYRRICAKIETVLEAKRGGGATA